MDVVYLDQNFNTKTTTFNGVLNLPQKTFITTFLYHGVPVFPTKLVDGITPLESLAFHDRYSLNLLTDKDLRLDRSLDFTNVQFRVLGCCDVIDNPFQNNQQYLKIFRLTLLPSDPIPSFEDDIQIIYYINGSPYVITPINLDLSKQNQRIFDFEISKDDSLKLLENSTITINYMVDTNYFGDFILDKTSLLEPTIFNFSLFSQGES